MAEIVGRLEMAKVESTTGEGESNDKEGDQVNTAKVTRGKDKVDLGHKEVFPLIQTPGREGQLRRDRLPEESHFGLVSKGWIDGIAIAVRRIKQQRLDSDYNLLAKINDLSKLNHPNLVKLIGYFLEEEHHIFLVYDFMYLHSLENHLFGNGFVTVRCIYSQDHNGKLFNFGLTEDVYSCGHRDTVGTIEFLYVEYAAPEYAAIGN
ncbi:hypothetical protein OSB04_016257 [Centaurea solstitialis]|uniref:Protein kinase domain-containing protein n=1 Tax=Centaurea solstitialis TaxID=347529 RepID=A0AA38W9M7_9ASTR|nr:hypothetical protein OSB04_016257 [Centaurea solstitialis]